MTTAVNPPDGLGSGSTTYVSKPCLGRRPSHWLFLGGAVIVSLAAVVSFTAVRVRQQAAVNEPRPADAIIVFGAAEYSGRPSPVFRARLDHAFKLFQQGVAPLVITTGGGARDPKFTEGEVGRDYLIMRGIPEPNLIAETQSDDTARSAERTAVILRANGLRRCVAVSDAYHMFRVKRLLESEGIVVYPSPRPDSVPRTFWARVTTALREACSYWYWKLHLP